MIKILIERVTTQKYTETQNFLTKKTPTDKMKPKDYGHGDERCFVEEYATEKIEKSKEVTTKLLEQNIVEESAFNLTDVIMAINGLEVKP